MLLQRIGRRHVDDPGGGLRSPAPVVSAMLTTTWSLVTRTVYSLQRTPEVTIGIQCSLFRQMNEDDEAMHEHYMNYMIQVQDTWADTLTIR